MDQTLAGEATLANRNELLELVVNDSNAAIYVTDADARIVFVNDTFTTMLGYPLEEVYGRSARDVFGSTRYSKADYARIWVDLNRGRSVNQEVRTHDRQGRDVWLTMVLRAVFDQAGLLKNLIGTLEDTTELRQVQRLQHDVLEAVAQETPLVDVMTMICERTEAMFPEIVATIVAVDGDGYLRPLAAPSMPAAYAEAINGVAIGPVAGSCGMAAWRGEPVVVVDIETDPLWVDYRQLVLPLGLLACWSSPIKRKDGRVAGTFAFYFRERRGPGSWHDQIVKACVQLCVLAFERHEAAARIARLAYYDGLTGLPNRTKLREVMVERFDNLVSPEPAALIFLDIDHFKDVNDTLGHSVGDRFLEQIANRLRLAVWPQDLIARHGGDEFVILLEGATAGRARKVAKDLLAAISQPVLVEGVSLPASASIGISLCPGDGVDSATLLRNADTAMYQAKREGRGTHRLFEPSMNAMAQDRLLLGALLRDAVANQQISLHYQPQINACTGRLAGAEALARWWHPALGFVPPDRFIPLAEDCGLIEEIGEFCLNEACAQLRRWDEAGHDVPHLSVNVSPIQFRNVELPGRVASVLASHGIAPSRLVVEITEGVMIDCYPAAIANASALRDMGVAISMDDFGTGYSSLNHLARLPVSELKIDRGFMADLEGSETVRALVTAVIRIGESLKLRVVAEGVETIAQRRFLEALGCGVLQGYLFARPMPAVDFADWVGAFSSPAPAARLQAS